jgi:hypothetical protein
LKATKSHQKEQFNNTLEVQSIYKGGLVSLRKWKETIGSHQLLADAYQPKIDKNSSPKSKTF